MKKRIKGIKYEKRIDGDCVLRTAAACEAAEVVIPRWIFGKGRVVAIEARAFQNCKKLTAVTLPQTLRRIGAYAFVGCDALTEITVGSRLESLHASSLRGSGYAQDPSRWKDGFLYLGNWIADCQERRDVYRIPADTVGIAADVFLATHVQREINPKYEETREQFYLALEVPDMPLPDLLEVPQYFEKIDPIRIQYEGTLSEWERVRKPSGEVRIPAEVTATDGVVSDFL